ncbi:uncharacterized protein LOC109606641 [Aethina tumida]|uniref:uncharacterized protein LOC109606641 n=1 Tax=Aethina tumida TaxID=116153 RepID=UPI00096B5326|nr:uncharacterized protein LOC109606641 [Aethina tumida]
MNGLYVTVSIPLLLVLAGFNHAHGLTTFGKSNNQGTQNTPNTAHAKQCTNQTNCAFIKGTTCLRGYCLCGDNTNPVNGGCNAQYKGPRHICENHEDCVEGADCVPKDKNKQQSSNSISTGSSSTTPAGDLICQCQEGLIEIGSQCGGGGTFSTVPAMVLLVVVYFSRTMY